MSQRKTKVDVSRAAVHLGPQNQASKRFWRDEIKQQTPAGHRVSLIITAHALKYVRRRVPSVKKVELMWSPGDDSLAHVICFGEDGDTFCFGTIDIDSVSVSVRK